LTVKTTVRVLLAGLGPLMAVAPMLAHHSFEAEYDRNKIVEVKGTVTRLDWMNPHARFYVDVKDESGKIATWNFELGSPNVLKRQGWTRTSLKTGDVVTVEGYLAKDGTKNFANARRVVLADGRSVFAGSSADGGEK
jgi:hypothetical protein